MKILIIEDDGETARYIATGLEEDGHVCEIAATGQTGLWRACAREWDLLILDRRLPDVDGLSVLRSLLQSASEVPVLCLTILAGVDHRVDGFNAGADDYLEKPLSTNCLNTHASCRQSGYPCDAA